MKINEFNNLPDSMRASFHSTLEDIYTANIDGSIRSAAFQNLFAEFLNGYFDLFYLSGDGADLLDFQIFIVAYAADSFTIEDEDVSQAFCDNLNDLLYLMLVKREFNPDHYFIYDDEV